MSAAAGGDHESRGNHRNPPKHRNSCNLVLGDRDS
jgi:hypothetical protein